MKSGKVIELSIWAMILFVLASAMVYFVHGGRISTAGGKVSYKGNLTQVKEEEQDLSDISEIKMDLRDADVEVRFGEASTIHVVEFTNDKDKDKENVFEMTKSGSKMEIKRGQTGRISFWAMNEYHLVQVEIPKAYKDVLTIETASGDIDLLDDAYVSDLTLCAASGAITCDKKVIADTINVSTASGEQEFENIEAGSYKFDMASGGIRINSLKGEGQLNGASGNIEIGELIGSKHELNTASGEIIIEKGQGNFEIASASGSIEIKQFEGAGEIQTISGGAYARNMVLTGDLDVQSTSGDVELEFENEVNAAVEMETGSGDLGGNVDLNYTDEDEDHATAVLGNGKENKVTIETTSGGVKVKQC